MTLREGDKGTLTATVEPANATNKNVEWWTSDLDVVSVTSTRAAAMVMWRQEGQERPRLQ